MMRAYSLLDDRGMDFAPVPSNCGMAAFTHSDENATLCQVGLPFRE
jgi:hypothetical protein